MMMSATWENTFSPVQIPGKSIFWGKHLTFSSKDAENGNNFFKVPCSDCWMYLCLKFRYEPKVITEKKKQNVLLN